MCHTLSRCLLLSLSPSHNNRLSRCSFFKPLVLTKETPVLDLERRPDARRVLDSVANQLTLLAQLEVDVLLIVLALDVRDVDSDEDVRLLLLEAQQRHDDGGEVGGRGRVTGRLRRHTRRLRRDERVGGDTRASCASVREWSRNEGRRPNVL